MRRAAAIAAPPMRTAAGAPLSRAVPRRLESGTLLASVREHMGLVAFVLLAMFFHHHHHWKRRAAGRGAGGWSGPCGTSWHEEWHRQWARKFERHEERRRRDRE